MRKIYEDANLKLGITPPIRWKIVARLLHPDTAAEGKSSVAREIKFLKMLEKQGYTDPEFWLNLNLGYQVRSVIWFKGDGAPVLKQAWGMYQMVKNQQKGLDDSRKEEIMAKMKMLKSMGTVEAALAARPVTPVPKKQTAIEWMDEYTL